MSRAKSLTWSFSGSHISLYMFHDVDILIVWLQDASWNLLGSYQPYVCCFSAGCYLCRVLNLFSPPEISPSHRPCNLTAIEHY